jgi:pre-mRNA-splicing helicase BRR2
MSVCMCMCLCCRDGLLQLPPEKMSDVAMFCNAYPNIELTYEMDADEGGVPAGETVVLKVLLSRDIGEEEVGSCASE